MSNESQDARRQFVNFVFYRVDPAWRRLPESERLQGKRDFCRVVEEYAGKMLIVSYSTMGMRGDCDFMLWRISYELEALQEMSARLLANGLGKYLTVPHSLLAMSKHSIYLKAHVHEGQTDSRARIVPGEHKYLFVYPFVKTRDWYRLTLPARQGIMNEHIQLGHRYPRVKLNTTYSFGLDDQEFVLAFETDYPADFLDLVMELRESESSRYTLRDTPIFTCVHASIDEVLDLLGG
jgi:chlorite dismutase